MPSKIVGFKKTRIAPTPSGYLHLGNALSFILTAGLAKHHGASMLLRIDDLDQERVRDEYVDDIFETLRFLGIGWSEGPTDRRDFERNWSQRNRGGQYHIALEYLAATGKVFGCNCSRTDIIGEGYPGTCIDVCRPLEESEMTWRLRTALDLPIIMNGMQGPYLSSYLPKSVQFAVVRRKNGTPSYQLASVVDDIQYGVDLVVRGADLLDSSLLQIQLAAMLDDKSFASAYFVHHPLITNDGSHKLSKSAGDTSIAGLRREGYTREQIMMRLATVAGLDGRYGSWEELFEDLAGRWMG